MKYGIAIVGANGSGKTTMGKKLADLLGYKHMDIEDYYFKKSEIPYTNPRTREEVQKLMQADVKKNDKFIISAVNCDLGEYINSLYNYVIYIQAPLDIRLERVRKRSFDKFGNRILVGGDMYKQEQKFFDSVVSRTMKKTDRWVKKLKCPVIYIDGTKPIEENCKLIIEKIQNNI